MTSEGRRGLACSEKCMPVRPHPCALANHASLTVVRHLRATRQLQTPQDSPLHQHRQSTPHITPIAFAADSSKMLARATFRAASAPTLVARRGFQSTRAQMASPYHYPEGPRSNLPFDPLKKGFAFKYWGFMGRLAQMPMAGMDMANKTRHRIRPSLPPCW
jgi:cytochrome c oxidase subunit 7c